MILILYTASIKYVRIGWEEGVVETPFKCVLTNVKSMGAYAGGLEIDFFKYVFNECRHREFL